MAIARNTMKISTKVLVGLAFLGVLTASIGGLSALYVTQIDTRLQAITQEGNPIIKTASTLVQIITEAEVISQNSIQTENPQELASLSEQYEDVKARYNATLQSLRNLVTDEDLLQNLDSIADALVAIEDLVAEMQAAHASALDVESNSRMALAAFNAAGGQLTVFLTDVATQSQADMQELRGYGNVMVDSGRGTAQSVNGLLGTLFDEEFPKVEAALKLQQIVSNMQASVALYMSLTNLDAMSIQEDTFFFARDDAEQHFNTLKENAFTSADEREIGSTFETFQLWSEQALGEGRLFASHTAVVENNQEVARLSGLVGLQAELIKELLTDVVAQAEAFSLETEAAASETVEQALTVISIGIFISIASLVLMAVFAVKYLTQRITAMTAAMNKLASGNLDTDIPSVESGDEIGEMAQAVLVFRDNAQEVGRLAAERKEAEARQQQERRQTMLSLAQQFEQNVGGIVGSVDDAAANLQNMAVVLTESIEDTSSQSTAVAAASRAATDSVESVAAAAEEMTASIQEISVNVSDTASTAKACATTAEQSQEKMLDLQKAVSEIEGVLSAINAVAEQTNLLALNATIEAARAGEAGKGFAVVANEVKSLANQTHKMTEEIYKKVDYMRESAAASITSVRDIVLKISQVDEMSASVAAAVEEQNSSTVEISRSAQHAAQGNGEVSTSIDLVLTASQTSAESTQNVKAASDDLAVQSQNLRRAMEEFLTEIRNT